MYCTIEFSGDPTQWPSFWQAFDSAVHSNSTLSNITKYRYLRQSLKAEALKSIEGMPLTNETYEQALEIIGSSFGNKRTVQHELNKKLLHIRPISSENDILRFGNELTTTIRTMRSVGLRDDQHEAFTSSVVHQKLNDRLQRLWVTHFWDKQAVSMEGILELITQEMQQSIQVEREKRKSNRESTFLTDINQIRTVKCFLCGTYGHSAGDCKLTMEERHDIVKKRRLCFNCLRKGHSLQQCSSKGRCTNCGKRHHSALCWGKKLEVKRVDEEYKPNIEMSHCLKVEEDPQSETTYQITNLRETANRVIPNATRIKMENGAPMVVLFDTGSTRTFIRRKFLESLSHTYIREENMIVTAFDKSTVTLTNVPILRVQIKVPKNPENVVIEAAAIEQIGSLQIQDSFFQQRINWEHPVSTECEIDLIIGIDQYWQVVQLKQPTKLPDSNLVQIETSLGPIISGTTIEKTALHESCLHIGEREVLRKCFDKTTKEQIQPSSIKDISKFITTNNENRIVIRLPFKEDERPTKNVSAALYRMTKYLSKVNYGSLDLVNEIKEMESNGIVEPIQELHFLLPYFHVEHNGKKRIVYDASFGKNSLNNFLHPCNMEYPLIDSILLRSRLYESIMLGDISKAFLQLEVAKEDRKFLQIAVPIEKKWVFYQFKRMPFGLSCGPQMFTSSLKLILANENAAIDVNRILNNSYMDDMMFCGNKVEERDREFNIISRVINKYHFKWGRVRRAEERVETTILGVKWTAEDSYKLKLPNLTQQCRSKRELLKFVGSVFDPIGISTPWLTKARHLIRTCWQARMNWDASLTEETTTMWKELLNELNLWKDVALPRFIMVNERTIIHCFVDASSIAIALSVYITNETKSRLLYAKSRLVQNSRNHTVQRSELNAILYGCQTIERIVEQCSILKKCKKVVVWSDSKDNLMRIMTKKLYKGAYVNNRLKKLAKYDEFEFRFCPCNMNMADFPSRYSKITMNALRDWICPPDWLKDENIWPANVAKVELSSYISNERTEESINENIFDRIIEKYRDWFTILRIAQKVQLFVDRTRKRKDQDNIELIASTVIGLEQKRILSSEWQRLKNSKSLTRISKFYREQIIYTDGTLRIRTRSLSDPEKYVIVIPNKSPILKSILWTIHINNFHCGASQLIFLFRKKYFAFKVRRSAKSLIMECCHCKLRKVKPLKQVEGLIPNYRTNLISPFRISGIDYAGPFRTIDQPKCYILLITCASSRAVYIQTTTSQDTSATMHCIRRFIARHGAPECFISDNGPAFLKVQKELQSKYFGNSSKVVKWKESCSWKTIPPRCPWWGGFYERLIGIVKRHLKFRGEKTPMNYQTFATTVTEIESVMNQRPLTAVLTATEEIASICPLDLLRPHRADEDQKEKTLFVHIEQQFKIYRGIRDQLLKTYLNELKFFHQSRNVNKSVELRNNDIVLIADDEDRRTWPLGIIEDVVKGPDNVIRLVRVRSTQNGKVQIRRRAVQRICLLEKAGCSELNEHN